MQRTFVAITLALAMTSAFAYTSFNTSAYVKAPVSVVADTELNYTNATAILASSVNVGELDIVGLNATAPTDGNLSNFKWNAVYRKLDGKALTASTNSSVSFVGGALTVFFLNGYAITFSNDNDTNSTPQISVYQAPVNGGAALGRILITSNTNVNYTPSALTYGIISKTVYVFYPVTTDKTKVNLTSFTAGGAKGANEYTLTSTYNKSLQVVWGESLGSNLLYVNWLDGASAALTYTTIDVTKGTVAPTAVTSWNSSYNCVPYATDKKWYGELCSLISGTGVNSTIGFYARTNGTGLLPLTNNTLNATQYSLSAVFPYGPYIAIVYGDSTVAGNTTFSVDIWNLDTLVQFRPRSLVVTTDASIQIYRVTSAGLYTLTANTNGKLNNQTLAYSGIQLGLFLGSSYLTSVLGFIMAVVAGLLAF